MNCLLPDKDKEIAEMAEMELEGLPEAIEDLEHQLKILLLPQDHNDDKNVIVEIKGALLVAMRATYLLVIYLRCMPDMLRQTTGK